MGVIVVAVCVTTLHGESEHKINMKETHMVCIVGQGTHFDNDIRALVVDEVVPFGYCVLIKDSGIFVDGERVY
jgi:late competence protein required for DNA uptake (superfamily II DNA/RNA helicase)